MHARHGLGLAAIILSLAPMAAGTAAAADKQSRARAAAIDKLATCKAIREDAARLACYDREASSLVAAADKGEISVVDREQAKSMRRSLFGFSLPKLGLFGGGDNDVSDQDVAKLDSTITTLTALPRGRWQFSIAEGGARWQPLEAPTRLIDPRVGQKVQIERAALGSYWVRFNGQNGVKGQRVN